MLNSKMKGFFCLFCLPWATSVSLLLFLSIHVFWVGTYIDCTERWPQTLTVLLCVCSKEVRTLASNLNTTCPSLLFTICTLNLVACFKCWNLILNGILRCRHVEFLKGKGSMHTKNEGWDWWPCKKPAEVFGPFCYVKESWLTLSMNQEWRPSAGMCLLVSWSWIS